MATVTTRLTRQLRGKVPRSGIQHYASCTCVPLVNSSARKFSVLNRPPPNYKGHIPLTTSERLFLATGSAILAFFTPQRGDLIALVGETTALPSILRNLRDQMLSHPSGRRILRERPRMTSTSLDLSRLRSLPPNTLGGTYVAWLDREHVSPDTRAPVRYIDDPELAYVMQRYRECHDFYHAITGMPVYRESEIALKAFEFANLGLPMTGLSVGSYLTVNADARRRLREIYLPWAVENGTRATCVLNVYWEKEMERDVDELRKEMGIVKPPDLRTMRAEEKARKKAAKEAAAAAAMGP